MPEISNSFKQLLLVLQQFDVEYVLDGGLACIFHGSTAQTLDIDIVPKRNIENLNKLASAMKSINSKLRGKNLENVEIPISGALLNNIGIGTWTTDLGDLDVIDGIPAGEGKTNYGYEKLKEANLKIPYGENAIFIASLEDVVWSKRAADRPKDHKTLPELEELLKKQAENNS